MLGSFQLNTSMHTSWIAWLSSPNASISEGKGDRPSTIYDLIFYETISIQIDGYQTTSHKTMPVSNLIASQS